MSAVTDNSPSLSLVFCVNLLLHLEIVYTLCSVFLVLGADRGGLGKHLISLTPGTISTGLRVDIPLLHNITNTPS
jgi:hypothetical protein